MFYEWMKTQQILKQTYETFIYEPYLLHLKKFGTPQKYSS